MISRCVYLFPLLLLTLFSCKDNVDPEVGTKFIEYGSREEQRASAIQELNSFYNSSSKDKQFYEVISKKNGRFILNYNRADERLTICLDPGSGWGRQYINISESDLADFISMGIELEDLEGSENVVRVDDYTLIIKGKELKYASSAERIQPKTNGNPTF